MKYRPIPELTEVQIERFLSHIEVAENGCWLWTSTMMKNGYAQVTIARQVLLAHRVAYAIWKGPVPDLPIDHVRAWGCRHRHCMNPDHLDAVTTGENQRRGKHHNKVKTHCPQNHEYTVENTYIEQRDGTWSRHCRTCKRVGSIA